MAIIWINSGRNNSYSRDILNVSTIKSGKAFYFYDGMASDIANDRIVFGIDYPNATLWMKGTSTDGYKPTRNHNCETIASKNFELSTIKDGRYVIEYDKKTKMHFAKIEFDVGVGDGNV